jgi:hypothetical protein
MNNEIVSLNYSAHAIDQLTNDLKKLKLIAPESANTLLNLIGLLKVSIKFILPNRGGFVDPFSLPDSELNLIRIPYPVVAFEVPWDKEEDNNFITKKIILCWENIAPEPISGLHDKFLNLYPDSGVFVAIFSWDNSNKVWISPVKGFFLPYKKMIINMDNFGKEKDTTEWSLLVIKKGKSASQRRGYLVDTFILQEEVFDKVINEKGISQADYQFSDDYGDLIDLILETCSVVNCSNIIALDLPPINALNKKRIKNGKQPFFTYKVLQLKETTKKKISIGEGSHASPRTHLRRGHIRRLEDKTVWVKPAVINGESTHGVVVKDYAINLSATP